MCTVSGIYEHIRLAKFVCFVFFGKCVFWQIYLGYISYCLIINDFKKQLMIMP